MSTQAVGPAVVPIGIFDGVHRGHQLVLQRAKQAARDRGAKVVVVTFDPHPVAILRPDAMPLMLTTIDRRIELLQQHGADDVVVLHFTEAMSLQTAEEFIEQTLLAQIGAVRIVVGHNFRFGHRAVGDVALLHKYDLEVDDVPLLNDQSLGGETISSTYIRDHIAHGDVEAAAKALGRPHFVEGPVVRGDARGRTLGFPTANVGVDHRIAIPADGVYAGRVLRSSTSTPSLAAISVGTNPTFDGVHRRVEAYVIDEGHELDLYDEHVQVTFEHRLRGMEKFASVDDLVAQMTKDVAAARARLH